MQRASDNLPYETTMQDEVVSLADHEHAIAMAVARHVGNMAISLTVRGHELLHWPYRSLTDFAAAPRLCGIPFLAPWANRLDEPAFYANGRRYAFDMDLGNVTGAIPIHGFLGTTSAWEVVEHRADATAAWLTSRLEFFRQPAWMKQFPFAHTIDMTYRLAGGVLEVTTTIENLSVDPMPVSIGYHPYFRLTDSPRDDWSISVAARTHWRLESSHRTRRIGCLHQQRSPRSHRRQWGA
jgi:aldose 1-epimerase